MGCDAAAIRRLANAAPAGATTVLAESCEARAERAAAGRNFQRAEFVEAGRSVGWRRPPMAA